ncbi:MAG: hypothetical protein JW963_04140 [Anaerolineales bacterium]|nr:hypothetical protein [Anaerolineales bacterium]
MLLDTVRYELPPEGITLLGYIVRRMHKTVWLTPVPELLARGHSAKALENIAIYTATSSTSYGRAYYQPNFNATGDIVSEPDPATGANVTARLDSRSPHYHISYNVGMSNGDAFQGKEEITGTTVGLRGLGMPAPSRFTFMSGEYMAELTGIITSELALSLLSRTRIRAYGSLNFKDNLGNAGRLELNRDGTLNITINEKVTRYSLSELAAPESA